MDLIPCATCPDAAFRNGAEARSVAAEVLRLQGRQTARGLEILAAALAAEDKFDQAGRAAQAALDLARRDGQHATVERIERELDTYRRARPWLEAVTMPDT